MSNKRIVVLGGGLVGGFIARTLARRHPGIVTLIDRDPGVLERYRANAQLDTRQVDLSSPKLLAPLLSDSTLVIGALPGHMGYSALAATLTAGCDCVDISFFAEDASDLELLANQHGARAIVDCGVMPGLGGMIAAQLYQELDTVQQLTIMVGGLPLERQPPLEYQAPFSPSDVIEEYTRPARLKIAGQVVTRPALSDVELIEFPEIGTLEAFNTDGLRSLLHTLPIREMREKTLRYPGHADKIRLLHELGFLDTAEVEVEGAQVSPRDLTAQLLSRTWQMEPGTAELTAMRVEVEGTQQEEHVRLYCDMLAYTDPDTGESSMARTTGWPAILATELVLEDKLKAEPGIIYPEILALNHETFEYFRQGLAAVGINLRFDRLVLD